MNVLELAINAGMQVTLDARIGTQEYSSVHGSLQAFQRFADALLNKYGLTSACADRERPDHSKVG